MIYDYRAHGQNLAGFCQQLIQYGNEYLSWQWAPALKPDAGNFLGHALTGEVLVVGDELNPKNDKLSWPFYEYGNCSLYLATCLQELGIHETDLLWTNSKGACGPTLELVLRRFSHLPVLALGAKAAHEVVRCGGVVRATVRHPQWGRRFDAGKTQYLDELVGAFKLCGLSPTLPSSCLRNLSLEGRAPSNDTV